MDFSLLIKAVIMGIVEGITEFLPISSTGHLILTDALLNFWTPEKADLFIVVIQLGAILAVIYLYWGRLWRALMGLITGKDPERKNPRQLGISLIISTIPIMLLGLMFDKILKALLFNPTVVAIMLIIGGLIIFWAEKQQHRIKYHEAEDIDIKTAVWIGLIQCLALIPGTSRSGSTIIGSLFLGVSRKASAEYSFFLGIPVLVGAGILDLAKNHNILSGSQDWTIMAVGTVVSFIFAMIFIKWLVNWVSTRDFTIFAWWRVVVGILVLLGSWMGYIQ
ncbi:MULTISPECIES: undecaprenyl-diphosphate phosphatase [unclassified Moraxella]|uniref:undecaprenyl-diphosphate phosphatase n=1 Tax=unclassified Moraxella TaxID=2685852 RepID=UPI003AF92C00